MLDHRPEAEYSQAITPWGRANSVQRYPKGIRSYGTPSHGGFCVPLKLADTMPEHLREIGERTGTGVWFEEDCGWSAVPTAFAECFTVEEIGHATSTLKSWYPSAFEQHYEIELKPGESFVKDERAWKEAHRDDWVVVSALRSTKHPGYTRCHAVLGGNHTMDSEYQYYLVKSDRYAQREKSHVIDTKGGDIEVTKQWFDEAWSSCYAK